MVVIVFKVISFKQIYIYSLFFKRKWEVTESDITTIDDLFFLCILVYHTVISEMLVDIILL